MNAFQSQDNVTGHFDRAANQYGSWYDKMDSEGHSFRIRRDRCFELLSALPEGSHVADIGCGPGVMIEGLLKKGFYVTGLDIAPQMIDECRKLFGYHPKARFDVSTAGHLPLPDQSQDAIVAMGLMEYLNDEPAIWKEFWRTLKPGGVVVVSFPHYWSLSRIWNRLTHLLARPVLALLKNKRKTSGVKHREYRLGQTIRDVERENFNIKDVVFYNFKLFVRPLDSLLPVVTVKTSEALERFTRTPVVRSIGTGFILVAEKRQDKTPQA